MSRKGALIAGIGVFLVILALGRMVIVEYQPNPHVSSPLTPVAHRDDPKAPVQVTDAMRWGCLTAGVFLAALGRQFTE